MPTIPIPAVIVTKTVWVPPAIPGDPPIRKVAQRTAIGHGNVPTDPTKRMQLRAHVIPFDPRTTAQLARRATFAAAQTAWAALDNTTKNLWNKSAIPERISGKNFFTRDYIANH